MITGDAAASLAIGRLYEQHGAALLTFARRRLGDRAGAAEDVLQTAFTKALGGWSTFDGQRPLAWLYQIVARACLDVHRGQSGDGQRGTMAGRPVRWDSLDSALHTAGLDSESEHGGARGPLAAAIRARLTDQATPETHLLAGEARLQQQASAGLLLECLPPAQRLLVWLRDYEGFDYASMARWTDTTVATVKSRLHRARLAIHAIAVYWQHPPRRRTVSLEARLWAMLPARQTAGPDACWPWVGAVTKSGRYLCPQLMVSYGHRKSKPRLARRLLYILTTGPLPPWAVVRSTCGASLCGNPAHLYAAELVSGPARPDRVFRPIAPQDGADGTRRLLVLPRGEALRAQRQAAGWTQRSLALAAGCTTTAISQMESGHAFGSIALRQRIAAALAEAQP